MNMDKYTATELAYKNGYAKGYEDGKASVEVKHGRWILKDDKGKGVCSACHRQDHIDSLASHCRYCGAKMDGKE